MELFDDERTVLMRVTTHTRMQEVWRELGKRKRKKRSSRAGDVGPDREYLHPVVPPATMRGISANAQAVAMTGIFLEAFRLGVERQATTRLEDVKQKKAAILDDAKSLRDIADELDESIRMRRPYDVHVSEFELAQKAHDADALRRIASWKDVDLC
jgi:hypothetical protein